MRPALPLVALLVFVPLVCGSARGLSPGSTLTPDNVFYTSNARGELRALAPDVDFAGLQLVLSTTAATPQDCAEACRADQKCDVFGHTACKQSQAVGCPECHLYSLGCTLTPLLSMNGSTGDTIATGTRTAGFPIRYVLNDVPGFTAEAGQGVPGADLQCNQTVVPGKCGIRPVRDAVLLCVRTPDCEAVVHYFKGLDGCSEPVSLLVHDRLTQSGAFLAPTVTTLSRVDDHEGALRDTTIMAPDGTVVLPPADQIPQGNSSTSAYTDTTWLGCIIAPNTLMAGTVVRVVDRVPSAEACCRECRGDTACNVWNFCAQPEGCRFAWGPRTLQLTQGQCELAYNEVVAPSSGFPPAVIDKGSQVPFIGGAPLSFYLPPLPGFSRLLGQNQFDYTGGSFNCSFTINPTADECVVIGSPEELAEKCQQTPECAGILAYPGTVAPGTAVGILKSNIDSGSIGLSPSNVLYIREESSGQPGPGSSGGGGGLSTGAIVGIAVGSAAAVAVTAAAAWLLLHRRRASRLAARKVTSSEEERGQFAKEADGSACNDVIVAGAVPGSHGSAPPSGSSAASGASWVSGSAGPPGSGPPSSFLPVGVRSVSHPASAGSGASASGRVLSPIAGAPHGGRAATTSRMASPFAGGPAGGGGTGRVSPFGSGPSGGGGTGRVSPFSSGPSGGGGTVPVSPSLSGGATANGGSLPVSTVSFGAGWAPAAAARTCRASVDFPVCASASPFAAARARMAGTLGSGGPGSMPLSAAGSKPTSQGAGFVSGGVSGQQPHPLDAPSSSSAGSYELAELRQHVAQCDAAMSGDHGTAVGGALLTEHSIISPGALPDSLHEWMVDINDIHFLLHPNGAPVELGSGASATVYKVLYRGETVAAKECDLGRSPAIQELFVKEAERLHQLRHAHVVALYGVALSGPRGILLCEYCSGRDLHSALQLKSAGTNRRLFGWYGYGQRVALDVAKALNFLHSKGCVHMDVKSSNVLLTGSGTAKLGDVGLARLQQGTHLSDNPKAIGTFAWMAPEVITGSRCTSAVDIFSMGVVLWEIITGEVPKRGEMRLPHVPEECPQDAADLITRCMSLDPEERPTAMQLMQQLHAMRARPAAKRAPAAPHQ